MSSPSESPQACWSAGSGSAHECGGTRHEPVHDYCGGECPIATPPEPAAFGSWVADRQQKGLGNNPSTRMSVSQRTVIWVLVLALLPVWSVARFAILNLAQPFLFSSESSGHPLSGAEQPKSSGAAVASGTRGGTSAASVPVNSCGNTRIRLATELCPCFANSGCHPGEDARR